jgi:hypothetical protein
MSMSTTAMISTAVAAAALLSTLPPTSGGAAAFLPPRPPIIVVGRGGGGDDGPLRRCRRQRGDATNPQLWPSSPLRRSGTIASKMAAMVSPRSAL